MFFLFIEIIFFDSISEAYTKHPQSESYSEGVLYIVTGYFLFLQNKEIIKLVIRV